MPTNISHPGTVYDDGITDASAVDNIQPVVTDGFGGPHAVFDQDHFKAQARFPTQLVEFKAAQGALVGHGYTWAVAMVAFNDDNTTELIQYPPTNTKVKAFIDAQLQVFLSLYRPKKMYLVWLNLDVDPVVYPWTFDSINVEIILS